jgi:hypothetical protein
MSAVRQVAVPAAVRALSTLERVDYADTFRVELADVRSRTAEDWARAVLEDAPLAVRGQLLSGWSSLGLKVGRGSVLGWHVRSSTPDQSPRRALDGLPGGRGSVLPDRPRSGRVDA